MSRDVLRHDTHCRVCGGRSTETVFRLNETPLEDQFVRPESRDVRQPVYPLELALCLDCGYVHLPHVVSPEASYTDYAYVSGVTVGLRNHYDDYARDIIKDFDIPDGSLAVDLGSNDGSMLASFKRAGMRVVGVEPAGVIAGQANDAGLPTINDFFTDAVAGKILSDHGPAGVVTANYMYANIDDVMSFTRSVSRLLAKDGIFVVQTGYHPEQMRIRMFDYIYHEHYSYFTVEVLKNIFQACGLELIRATKTSPKGGSIRVVGQLRGGSRAADASVSRIIVEERAGGMRAAATYQKFAADIQLAKEQVLEKLRSLKNAGKRIIGFGASHSTTTLTCHFELAPFLEYLVDDNPLKHGRYSPGHHLPVYPSEKMYEDHVDYVIVLAWQHQRSILDRHKAFVTSGGKFLVPLPNLRIVDAQ
ncbi:MAG: class I SAM-dependent methyltransferase [Nitrospiraceae bacterium]